MPTGIIEQLQVLYGERFRSQPRLERLILATAATEQVISHKRISDISIDHSRDITIALQALVKQGLQMINSTTAMAVVLFIICRGRIYQPRIRSSV
ncbi:hypothetical protein LZ24_00378 [Desulfobotulus alkaliphilus]|uniref:Uncharacterized protein n=2 Tax=Desulfobotulus alkaliphilus TaxID=622671 RepID=A0A562S621_9BACT|nr:hypothetical protein LZ24_00378 [Desulfobotulus alkaliphilus]